MDSEWYGKTGLVFHGQENKWCLKLKITVVSSKKHWKYKGKMYSDGGFGKVIEGLATNFEIVTLAVPTLEVKDEKPGYQIKSSNVVYEELPSYGSELEFITKLPRIITRINTIVRRSQLLQFWLPGYESVIATFLKGNKKSLCYVGGDWEWISAYHRKEWARKPLAWFNKACTKYVLKRSTNFIMGNQLYRKWKHLPNVYETTNSTILKKDIVKYRETCKNETKKLLFVGRISPEKNLNIAVQALHQLNDEGIKCRLKVIGTGNEKHETSKYIKYAGFVPQGEELNKAFLESDIFVFPSSENTIAKVTIEAMSKSLPVVCSDLGAFPHQLSGGHHACLIKANNVQALKNGIKKVIKDKSYRERITINSLRAAEAYCIDQIWKERLAKCKL